MITDYGTYSIQTPFADDGGYFHPPWALQIRCEIRTWHQPPNPPPFDAEQFLFIKASGSRSYYIVNRRSGLLLTLNQAFLPPVGFETCESLWQSQYEPTDDIAFRFFVEEVPGTDDQYQLSACAGRFVMQSTGAGNAQQLLALDPGIVQGKRTDFNTFFIRESVRAAPEVGAGPDAGMQLEWFETARPKKRPPRVQSIDSASPSGEAPEMAQETVVPFFMVRDPWYDSHEQVVESPFYRFTHRIGWYLARDRTLDGPVERIEQERTAVGMTTSAAMSFDYTFRTEKTSGWNAGVKAGVKGGKKGVEGNVGGSFGYAKSKTETRAFDLAYEAAVEAQTERVVTETHTYKESKYRYRILTWRIVDIFELRRADDDRSLVNAWKSIRADDEFIDKVIDH